MINAPKRVITLKVVSSARNCVWAEFRSCSGNLLKQFISQSVPSASHLYSICQCIAALAATIALKRNNNCNTNKAYQKSLLHSFRFHFRIRCQRTTQNASACSPIYKISIHSHTHFHTRIHLNVCVCVRALLINVAFSSNWVCTVGFRQVIACLNETEV